MDREIVKIFEKAYAREHITQAECIKLLSLDDASAEACTMRGLASAIVRERTDNTGSIFAQIGLQCFPCKGNCDFCSFAEKYGMMGHFKMDDAAILSKLAVQMYAHPYFNYFSAFLQIQPRTAVNRYLYFCRYY